MSRAALSNLVEHSRHVFYEAGDVIVNQGDDDSCVYLILAGRVRVFQMQSVPAGEPLAELGPGEIFGELAILEMQPRSATVLTIEPTSCLRVSGPAFIAALNHALG